MTAPATEQNEMPAPARMLQIISNFWTSRALYITAKLGIPDLLKSGPKATAKECCSMPRKSSRVPLLTPSA